MEGTCQKLRSFFFFFLIPVKREIKTESKGWMAKMSESTIY